jgi:hypothetical protein
MTPWVVLALLAFAAPTVAYAQAFPNKVIGLAAFSVLIFTKALGLPIPVRGAWFGG